MKGSDARPGGKPALSQRRWSRATLGVLIVVTLLAGGGTAYLQALDSTTPVSVDAALSEFRERAATTQAVTTADPSTTGAAPALGPSSSPAGDPRVVAAANETPGSSAATATTTAPEVVPGHALPAEGVYVYETSGGENVTVVGGLGRGSHTYPDQTTIQLTHEGCGARLHWVALQERWDEWSTCLTDRGEEYVTFTSYHEFFGEKDRRDYRCDPGSLFRPWDDTPGTLYPMNCHSEDGKGQLRSEGKVVGHETVQVAGEAIDTVHLWLKMIMEGDTRGWMVWETWVLPSSGLIVRARGEVDSDGDTSFGNVHYEEALEMTLASLEPRR